MKIKLSRNQWEEMGKKAGWMKTSAESPDKSFDHRDPKNYAPGQTPYTDSEWEKVRKMISDAAEEDPGELGEAEALKESDDSISRRRSIKINFNNGDYLTTDITGTKKDILKYYLPHGDKGEAQDYDINQPDKVRWPISVEFLS